MSDAASYQSVREQLISLQVDLDDKKKVCAVLDHKIGVERAKLGRIEADATQEYEAILEAEFANGQQETERLKTTSTKLVDAKRELGQRCQALVESVKEREADLATERRRLHHEAAEALDRDRKTFRQTHSQRLAKFLASKAAEEKESTSKALQPEFARLQQLHERELAGVEEAATDQERRLRDEHQTRLESLLREERDAAVETQRSASRQRAAAVEGELASAEREHAVRLSSMRAELETEMDRLRTSLQSKVSKERQGGQNEVQRAQEAFQQRLQSLRAQHMTEMNAVLRNHDEQCRLVEEQAAKSRDAMEARLQDVAEEMTGAGRHGDKIDGEHLRALQADRNKRLQTEIRRLQAESVRLERDWKARADEQRRHIQDSREKEETETKRRQRGLTEDVSELAVERELRRKEATALSEQLDECRAELQSLTKEADVYRSGIAAHRMRQRDVQTSHASRTHDEQRGHVSRVDTLNARITKLRQQTRAKSSALARDLAALEALHVGEMEKLDRAVKDDVAKKDDDLELLRDAVATEKVKVARLEKLIKQSGKSASLSSGGSGASVYSARSRGRH